MQPQSADTVFIVDDDGGVREAMAWLLRSRRIFSEAFESAERFEQHRPPKPFSQAALLEPLCWLL